MRRIAGQIFLSRRGANHGHHRPGSVGAGRSLRRLGRFACPRSVRRSAIVGRKWRWRVQTIDDFLKGRLRNDAHPPGDIIMGLRHPGTAENRFRWGPFSKSSRRKKSGGVSRKSLAVVVAAGKDVSVKGGCFGARRFPRPSAAAGRHGEPSWKFPTAPTSRSPHSDHGRPQTPIHRSG